MTDAKELAGRLRKTTPILISVDAPLSAKACDEAAALIISQAAEIEGLEAALKPFADVLGGHYSHQSDHLALVGHGDNDKRFNLTLGDFRRAKVIFERKD